MFNPNEHLMPLKGKDYLQVMWRLVWFRDEKPNWSIDTQLIEVSDRHAIFTAKITDENGIQKSSGYGSETAKDFGDFIEKAETKAVGRALAMLGYGTQFTGDELDEHNRIVDSPVDRKKKAEPKAADPLDKLLVCDKCGKVIQTATPKKWAERSKEMHGKVLCLGCINELNEG